MIRFCPILKTVFLILLITYVIPSSASAERPIRPLTGNFRIATGLPRTDAPILADVTLAWKGKELLKGVLRITAEINFLNTRESLYVYETPPQVLHKGKRSLRLLLPPVHSDYALNNLFFSLEFLSESGNNYKAGRYRISMPDGIETVLAAAVYIPPGLYGPGPEKMAGTLDFKNAVPANMSTIRQHIITTVTIIENSDFPDQPCWLCGFDIVVMWRQSVAGLSDKQISALEKWVKGGGSLCVVFEKRRHVSNKMLHFVNRLLRADSNGVYADTNALELIDADSQTTDDVFCIHPGAGRIVLIPDMHALYPEWNKPAWKEALRFMWRVRKRSKDTSPDREQPDKSLRKFNNTYGYIGDGVFFGTEAKKHLLPETIQVVPPGLLVLILCLLGILVGPFDYFIMPLLKLRRFTWLYFPFICILFGCITVRLAVHYMGTHDIHRSIHVIDVDRTGSILRYTGIKVSTHAADVRSVLDISRSLTSSMDTWNLLHNETDTNHNYGSVAQFRKKRNGKDLFLDYCGSVPARYSAVRDTGKWVPRAVRTFSFKLPDKRYAPTNTEKSFFSEYIRGNISDLPKKKPEQPFQIFRAENGSVHEWKESTSSLLTSDWIKKLVWSSDAVFKNNNRRLLAAVSHISPNGSGDLCDLMLMDKRNKDLHAVILTKKSGSDIIIYRCLYGGDHKNGIR